MKKYLAILIGLLMILGVFSGCNGTKQNDSSVPSDPVTLTVVGPWEDCAAVEVIASEFKKSYPNCTINYEYLQNFDEGVAKRLENNDSIDLFLSNGVDDLTQYLVDFKTVGGIDLSDTFDGLIENATTTDDAGVKTLYQIPLGAEMRGLYVNTTLLDKYNISVPTKQAELLAACATLKENGYIAMNGNPGTFGQQLLYPWISNIISNADNYEEAYAKVVARGAGLSEMFREPFEFLYTLVENGYYEYKTVEKYGCIIGNTDESDGLFTDASDEAVARNFFNIKASGDEYAFEEGTGEVAFLVGALSQKSTYDKVKSDYHSTVEYVFIPAPVGEDGGFVYLSPAKAIAANKNSANVEWSIRFLNFLFTPENNEIFTEAFNAIPNTQNAFSYISELYSVPSNHISQVGQVSNFGYNFYKTMASALTDTSKANNPKYMVVDENGTYTNSDGEKCSMQTLGYYMDALEASLVSAE